MTDRSAAEEHLRVIRSLMERSTIYRTISAEAAAVGGVLAIIASFAFGNWLPWREVEPLLSSPAKIWQFLAVWEVTLFFAASANLIFLYRASARRNEPFISSGMRLAVLSLLPGLLVAAWLTTHVFSGDPTRIVPIWITCYGLSLLATKPFAPQSLVVLGWAFLIAGLISFDVVVVSGFELFRELPVEVDVLDGKWVNLHLAQGLMAVTFGLFHLIYAACTWPRRATQSEVGATP